MDDFRDVLFWGFVVFVVLWYFLVFIGGIGTTPTALDVYRGRTTLEITYRDGAAVDSAVVYRDKESR